MGLIQDIVGKIKANKESKEGYAREMHTREEFEQKKKSSNERELERIMEEKRQQQIGKILKDIRHKENEQFWSGHFHSPADTPNVLVNHEKIFKSGQNVARCPNVVTNTPNVVKTRRVV